MKLVNNGKAAVCRACLQVKPIEQFHKHKYKELGISKYCCSCGVKPGNYRPEARYSKFTEYN